MSTPYHNPPTEIPGLDEWNAANQRAREEYAAYPFAHLREKTVVRDRTYYAERQAAYRARKAGER